MKANFVALDTMTLLEIEQIFSSRQNSSIPQKAVGQPVAISIRSGRRYMAVEGAVFYELEDLMLA